MIHIRPFRFMVILAAALILASSGAGASHSASRGEVVHSVIKALQLPEWGGGRHFTDLGHHHPFATSIETAAALGILNPTEQFYPDIEASRAEALMFSLQAMGLRHEASLMGVFERGAFPDLPPYIAPYISLATDLDPAPPRQFLLDPKGSLSEQDLRSLEIWLRNCRQQLSWRKEIASGNSVLLLWRKHAGTPPPEWAVQSGEFGNEEDARILADKLRVAGFPAGAHALEWTWVVRIGPFSHYLEAWETMMKIPSPDMTVAPFSQSPSKALFIAALGFDPSATPPRIVTASSISGRRLPLGIIAENSGAEGAINGGFFSGSRIVGSLVIRSRPVSGPYGDRSAMGWSSDGSNISFGRGDFKTIIRIGEREFSVSTINSVPPQGGIGLFTPDVWAYVTGAPPDGVEMTVKDGTVTGIRHAASSNHFVTREGFLVIARGYPARSIQEVSAGTAVSIRTEWAEPGFSGMDYVLQAGPMLLKGGTARNNTEGFDQRTLSVPHPRSFIGSDGERLWFVVVDGRDPWHSGGVTITETAAVARQLGLVNALNLDGGGSSSIWWKGLVVNSPSGGAVRPVPYALVF